VVHGGTRLLAIGGEPVAHLGEARDALRRLTADAWRRAAGPAEVAVTLAPIDGTPTEVRWRLEQDDLDRLHALGFTADIDLRVFRPALVEVRGDGPVEALAMGVRETNRVILMTYVTFARLFQGTVKIEHLKGPIGIAHLGTQAAERGATWLLFFMALISVNLAVVNFLPLPIVDGGQFLFLALEGVRGRPVSMGIQQVVTVAGLVLIAAVFLLVTYNDILGLFAG
jgi:regulator of sigma E protease